MVKLSCELSLPPWLLFTSFPEPQSPIKEIALIERIMKTKTEIFDSKG